MKHFNTNQLTYDKTLNSFIGCASDIGWFNSSPMPQLNSVCITNPKTNNSEVFTVCGTESEKNYKWNVMVVNYKSTTSNTELTIFND